MKLSETAPIIYGVNMFKYNKKNKYFSFTSEKSQYVYRFIFLTKGGLTVYIDDNATECKAGDVIFLTPGQRYRLKESESEFSLLNVYFDFSSQRNNGINTSCVFLQDFSFELCSEKIDFEDGEVLNKSSVFFGVGGEEIFKSPCLLNKTDPLFEFHSKSAVLYFISRLLQNRNINERSVGKAEEIIRFINLHPEGDLSPEFLSEKFSYHKNYINSLIKTATGMSLSAYIKTVKIQYAKVLLSEGEFSLTAVAATLGYYDYSHFYKAFASVTGMSPTEYIKRLAQ